MGDKSATQPLFHIPIEWTINVKPATSRVWLQIVSLAAVTTLMALTKILLARIL
jgi:hypothetical protein